MIRKSSRDRFSGINKKVKESKVNIYKKLIDNKCVTIDRASGMPKMVNHTDGYQVGVRTILTLPMELVTSELFGDLVMGLETPDTDYTISFWIEPISNKLEIKTSIFLKTVYKAFNAGELYEQTRVWDYELQQELFTNREYLNLRKVKNLI